MTSNNFILRTPRESYLLPLRKLQPYLLKQPLKMQKTLQELEIMY